MKAPKCKLCGLEHWAGVCPNVGKKAVKARVAAIASAPVKKGGKAKKKAAAK